MAKEPTFDQEMDKLLLRSGFPPMDVAVKTPVNAFAGAGERYKHVVINNPGWHVSDAAAERDAALRQHVSQMPADAAAAHLEQAERVRQRRAAKSARPLALARS